MFPKALMSILRWLGAPWRVLRAPKAASARVSRSFSLTDPATATSAFVPAPPSEKASTTPPLVAQQRHVGGLQGRVLRVGPGNLVQAVVRVGAADAKVIAKRHRAGRRFDHA